jgi:cbb3-type cytochrome oxidase subunit 3
MNLSGLILLVFIAIGIGWVWNKGRKKIGLPANARTWGLAILVIIVVIMIYYGASHTPHH